MVQSAQQRMKTWIDTYLMKYDASGTADAGGDTTHTVDAERTEAADYWNGYYIKYLTGDNIGEYKLITDFDAATDTLTHEAFTNTCDAGDTYVIAEYAETPLATSIMKNDGTTNAAYVVMYSNPDYPLWQEFAAKMVDCIFAVAPAATVDSLTDAVTLSAYGYKESVPIYLQTIDKTGITGVKMLQKMLAALRLLEETYPTGSLRLPDGETPDTVQLGSTTLYSLKCIIDYTRDVTT